tara:strand:- start:1969 stop:2364 length:396 start_codon:yes stop_codon:yes gene_type:complete
MNQVELLRHVADNLEAGRAAGIGLLFNKCSLVSTSISNIWWRKPSFYTLAPRTHKVNSFDVPVPESKELKSREQYYTACPTATCYFDIHAWVGDAVDLKNLKRGLIHLTPEAAIANGKAMCGTDPEAETEE